MAKADSTQEQTVEEILASIRQAISADETRRVPMPGAAARLDAATPMTEMRPSGAAAGKEPPAGPAAPGDPAPPAMPADRSQMHDVIELAIEQALDGVGEGAAPATAPSQPPLRMMPPARPLMRPEASPRPHVEPRPGRDLPRPASEPAQRRSLLSPRANAAVATSFEDLARALETNSGRSLDQTVEDVLRPMLRSWLDDNLPSLVERLVREEIERVSRGRR